MTRNDRGSGFLLGLLAGAAVTAAAVVLIQRSRRARSAGIEGRAAAERRLESLERGSSRYRARREERARRQLASRIEEMRSAGL